MKQIIFLLFTSVLFFSCTVKKGVHTTIYNLDEVNSELVVYLKIGETAKITAQTNPSTGYNWSVNYTDNCSAKLINETTEAIYSDDRVGTPLRAIYNFKGENIGTCILAFDYSRSWEQEKTNIKYVKFVVR